MRKEDIYWRIAPLQDVMAGIEAGLSRIQTRMDDVEWFDVDQALEHSVWLLGVAFVAAQAYIEGTIGEVWRVQNEKDHVQSNASRKFTSECHSHDTALAPGVTRIQFINAVANHFKHRESPRGLDEHVWGVLRAAGITEKTEYPCARATELLCGEKWRLRALTEVVKEWRAHIFSRMGRGKAHPPS